MRVSTIPLAALIGLPALSAAFLLPPPLDLELSPLLNPNEAEVAVLSDTPKSAIVKGTHIAVALPCIGCTWHKDVSDEEGVPFTKGLESELLFDITIPADSPNSLVINNKRIVPFTPLFGLSALQVPASASAEDVFTISHPFRPLKLGYDLLVTGTINAEVPDKKDIRVKLRITAVDGVHNDYIPDMEVLVSEDIKTGALEIVSSYISPIVLGPGHHADIHDEEVSCQGIDCVISDMKHRLESLGIMHGKDSKKGGCHNGKNGGEAPPNLPHDGPHRGGPGRHGPHHHHHGHRQGGHFWAALIGHVLMPIIIGIMAGVSVSIMGVIVGQSIMKLWKFAKACKNSGKIEDGQNEEGRGMLKAYVDEQHDEKEALPAYFEEGIEVVEKE
ncbi:hypothetical protein DFP73DRAFT_595205 [Morchella snyderi]|nr:hypothetical protein DFP73DRAFT_595205 [Morchella snyderi]